MSLLKKKMLEIWNDESAQGITEYILLLVVVVAVVALFRNRIQQVVSDKITQLGNSISQFNP